MPNTLALNTSNFASTQQGDNTSETSMVTKLQNCIPMWQRHGDWRLQSFPAQMHILHRIGKLTTIANITGTPVNPQDYQEVGRTKTTMNDGVGFTFPITFVGNDRLNLMMMLGIDPTKIAGTTDKSNTPTAIKVGKDYGICGNFHMYYAAESQHLVTSMVVLNCGIRVLEITGAGDNLTYNVEIYSDNEAVTVALGQAIVAEKFYEDGVLFTGGQSPDGILTTFQAGWGVANGTTGAGSLSLTQQATLAASKLRLVSYDTTKAITDAFRFFIEIRIDGTPVNPNEITGYSQSTGLVTFANPPAAGSILEWVYIVNTGFPDWDAERNYGVGINVEYSGQVWHSVTPVLGTAPAAGPWTSLGLTTLWDRTPQNWGVNSNPKNWENPSNMFVSCESLIAY